MRAALLTLVLLTLPVTANAQANQTSRTIIDSAGRHVTCTIGQIGQRQTRGVSIIGRHSSTIDAEPTDALWRSSGCHAEMSLTPQQRFDRTMAELNAQRGPRPGERDTRYEDIMRDWRPQQELGPDRPSLGGATYVSSAGDSITGISRRFEVPVAEIERANNRLLRGSLPAGGRITLPENAVDGGPDPYASGAVIVPGGAD